jgi:hypothetical protein
VSDRPIIKIAIDAEDFDKFSDRFNAYREKLSNQPEEWKATNAEIKEMKSNFEDAGKALEKIQKGSSVTPTVERKEKERSKRVKEDEKSWKSIGKSISGSYRDLSGLAKMSVGISSGKLGLGSLGALGAIYGAMLASANGLAERNQQNRQLDVAPGVAKAYGKAYAKFGGSEQQLGTFEAAKVTPQMWQPMLAVGITQDEIQNDDAEQLAATYLRKGGQKWESLPEYARGNWMAGTNQGDLGMSVGSFNQAGSFKDQAPWDLAQSDFEKYRQQDADAQPDLDAGTEFKQHVGADWDAITKSFDHNAALLAPALEHWSDAATKFTVAFLNQAGPQAAELADDINGTPPAIDPTNPYPNTVDGGLRKFGDGAWKYIDAFKDTKGIEKAGESSSPNETIVRNWVKGHFREGGLASLRLNDPDKFNDIESANGLRPGFLRNIERQESSYGRNVGPNTNDSDGPAGPFQIDKGTAGAWGVRDRMDEADSAQGAGAGFAKLLKKYQGDYGAAVADYDGFRGIGDDYKKYGPNWRAHLEEFDTSPGHKATRETTKYLSDLEANGADLSRDGGSAQVSVGTVTALSKIAGSHPDNRIIDAGSAAGGKQPPMLSRPAGMGALPAQQINVAVSAPPGSSVSVTTAGFPQ